MTLNQFTKAVLRQPFRPFQLVTSDGHIHFVDHPEFVSISRSGREVTFYDAQDMRHDIDARLIIKIMAFEGEVPAGVVAPNPNGGDR